MQYHGQLVLPRVVIQLEQRDEHDEQVAEGAERDWALTNPVILLWVATLLVGQVNLHTMPTASEIPRQRMQPEV